MNETHVLLNKILEAQQMTNAKLEANTLELARLSGKVEGLTDRMDRLEEKVDRIDERLTKVEERLDSMEQKFDRMEESHNILLDRIHQNEIDVRQLRKAK